MKYNSNLKYRNSSDRQLKLLISIRTYNTVLFSINFRCRVMTIDQTLIETHLWNNNREIVKF